MAEAQPEHIGRYRVEDVLGRGAMGVIYRAHDPVIDRKVALKLVRADLLDGDDRADYIARFQQEAQAAARCAHPNIVAVYDFALHEGNPYLAMEYINGVTLNQVSKRVDGFTAAEVVDLIGQTLDGLGSAHALGVVHRDIKPANIMLTDQGRVKVTDFGVSRLDSSQMTEAGAVLGTPSYMSPEQCRGETVDQRSDLFSTGVLLYELATGTKPFPGKSQHEVWHRLLNEAPPDPATLRPGLPNAILETISKSLAKTPRDRYGSAHEMAIALRSGEAGASGHALAQSIDLDRTTVLPSREANPAVQIDSMAIGTIERGLARYVGPIAHYLLKSAIRRSDTVETLCRTLAESIESPESRVSFNKEMQIHLAGSLPRTTTTRAQTTLLDTDLLRAQQALTRYVGPVSRVLVKRAAPGCGDLPQLWQRLAQHVEQPGDRAAFLKSLAE